MDYFISDLHLGHVNIISYCNRPFDSLEQMHREIIYKWNQKVSKKDVVWILGDFALADIKSITEWQERLNGNKRLILGNHDRHSIKQYYEAGFKRVYDMPILYKDTIALSHYPLNVSFMSNWFQNIHGHIHDRAAAPTVTHHSFNVCADVMGFVPLEINEIIKRMENVEC